MKKACIFTLILIAVFVFACTLPSSIEIKGNPALRFYSKIDLSEMFSKMITDGFSNDGDGAKALACANTSIQTYIIHMELYSGELSLNTHFPPSSGDQTVTTPINDLVTSTVPMKLPLKSMEGFLENFELKSVETKLYVSGSKIAEILSVELKVTDEHQMTEYGTESVDIKNSRSSGYETWGNSYTGTTLPGYGDKVTMFSQLLNEQDDFDINFGININPGKTIKQEWINNSQNVKVELVVWLPLEFIAGDEAYLNFPDDFFDDENDLFGRETADEDNSLTQMIKSLRLSIEMNKNPFQGNILIIDSSGGLEILNVLNGSSLDFPISEENMNKINTPEYFPFVPKFRIRFSKNGILSIPRDFSASYICFDASISYIFDLAGGGN